MIHNRTAVDLELGSHGGFARDAISLLLLCILLGWVMKELSTEIVNLCRARRDPRPAARRSYFATRCGPRDFNHTLDKEDFSEGIHCRRPPRPKPTAPPLNED